MLNAILLATACLAELGLGSIGATSPSTEISVPGNADDGVPRLPTTKDPLAKDAQTICPGYKATNVKTTNSGMTATLNLNGKHCQAYGNDIDTLSFTMSYQADDRINVKIQPASIGSHNYTWYILPEYLAPIPQTEPNHGNASLTNDLTFHWSNNPTFNFKVVRNSNGDTLFDTSGSKIVYEDQFIEFVTQMPENYNLYGLGETIHGFRLGNDFVKTMYAADIGDPIDGNIYGTHPVYIDTRYYEQNGTKAGSKPVSRSEVDSSNNYVAYSHGLYNRNAHGQDILMNPTNITWRAIGGSIDLYFYSGPDAKSAITSYQQTATGLPAMQQYWTLGYHQCRWGYNNWSVVENVVDTFKQFEIPLETIWTDIDYMYQYRDFENDPTRFNYSEGQAFLDRLHADNQHYVPIVDAAIYVPNANNDSDAYPPFTRGNATNSFMLNPDGSLYVGNVWPGFTVFPDFLPGSGANEWWANEFLLWHNNINWDGIWLDMNEVSSFCVGSCGSLNLSQNPVHPPFMLPGEPGSVPYGYPEGFQNTNASEAASASAASASQDAYNSAMNPAATTTSTTYLRTTPTPGVRNINYPPYVINNDQGDLAVHAVSVNATHHNGVKEYDVHNVWGHTEINATYNALLNIFPGKRPFIIARSTFVSSGKHTGHWGGDNASKFYYMYFSIPQALQFSIFGIPMFGVDTCGFQQNTDEELCNRWMQLSAFFPFYRNHNDISSIPQEPYNWASVTEATKIAMAIRFQLLPYLYTLMQNAHTKGDTVMRALAWEYPNDPTLANADRQFFLGPAILVTPVLIEGADTVDGVFPGSGRGEIYYDWYNQTQIQAGKSENVTISAPLGHIPVYVRGGYVIPMQQPAMTTTEGRNTPWSVLVPLGSKGKATGELYLDDGTSVSPPSSRTVQLSATSSSLSASPSGQFQDTNKLSNVTVLGVQKAPGTIQFNGKTVKQHTYNSTSKVLVVQGLEQFTSSGAWAKSWKLTW